MESVIKSIVLGICVVIIIVVGGVLYKTNELRKDELLLVSGKSIPSCFTVAECRIRLTHDSALLVDNQGTLIRELETHEYNSELQPKVRTRVVTLEAQTILRIKIKEI